MHKALDCLEFYSVNEWCFVSQNIGRLMDKMTPRDQEIFNFDVRQIDWESYIDTYACGVRQHLLRDDMSTLSAAKKNLKRLVLRLGHIRFSARNTCFSKVENFQLPKAENLRSQSKIRFGHVVW